MAVTVFVWYPKKGNIGHATLLVAGGVYVSWWPSRDDAGVSRKNMQKWGNAAGMFGSTAEASSMTADKKMEGHRNPDWASAPIEGLDEAKINQWFQDLSPKSPMGASRHTPVRTVGTYSLLDKQCSSTVVEALIVGGLSAWKFPLAYTLLFKTTYITPLDVKDIASAMTHEVGFFEAGRLLATPVGTNLVKHLAN